MADKPSQPIDIPIPTGPKGRPRVISHSAIPGPSFINPGQYRDRFLPLSPEYPARYFESSSPHLQILVALAVLVVWRPCPETALLTLDPNVSSSKPKVALLALDLKVYSNTLEKPSTPNQSPTSNQDGSLCPVPRRRRPLRR
jgi:hypothetical protein